MAVEGALEGLGAHVCLGKSNVYYSRLLLREGGGGEKGGPGVFFSRPISFLPFYFCVSSLLICFYCICPLKIRFPHRPPLPYCPPPPPHPVATPLHIVIFERGWMWCLLWIRIQGCRRFSKDVVFQLQCHWDTFKVYITSVRVMIGTYQCLKNYGI